MSVVSADVAFVQPAICSRDVHVFIIGVHVYITCYWDFPSENYYLQSSVYTYVADNDGILICTMSWLSFVCIVNFFCIFDILKMTDWIGFYIVYGWLHGGSNAAFVCCNDVTVNQQWWLTLTATAGSQLLGNYYPGILGGQ